MYRRPDDIPGGVPEISAREAWRRLNDAEARPRPVLVDVREPWEYAQGHAASALNVPLSAFRARFADLPSDADLFMICHVGERSLLAARFLKQQGFARVSNVAGGTEQWEAARLPLERGLA